jgi:arylsulfatase A-like enzyme
MKPEQKSPGNITRRDVLKYGLCGGLTLGLSSSLWLSGCRSSGRKKTPSVILITVDTLRPDHLGCYGYSKPTTANLDRFASEAMLFENCFSHAPITSSSLVSLLTGFLPHETHVFENWPLPEQLDTLPEMLQKRGYKTVAVVCNPLLQGKNGWAACFSVYDETMNSVEIVRHWPERVAKDATDRAIELLRQFYRQPLFLWIHYQDPHGPYTPPQHYGDIFYDPKQPPRNLKVNDTVSGLGGIPSYQRLGSHTDFYYYLAQYNGEIRYWDEHFGRLLDAMKDMGLYDDALILFSADHGEDLGERNYFFCHGENLYSSLTHVPLIIRYGGQLKGRKTPFVQHLDVVPTVLEFIGGKRSGLLRGCDLLNGEPAGREIFAEERSPIAPPKMSVIFDGFKLIYTAQPQNYELFNLNTDYNEEHNLIKDPAYRQQLTDLGRRMLRIEREDLLGLDVINKPVKHSAEEIEKLKSLGYTE